MGDRAYFEMTIDKEDLDRVNEIMFNIDTNADANDYWDEINENPVPKVTPDPTLTQPPAPTPPPVPTPTITLVCYEANYGFYRELDDLKGAEPPINFEGSHGPGSEYSGSLFACYNNRYASVNAIDDEPVVLVSRDGVNEIELGFVEQYFLIYDLVVGGDDENENEKKINV